MEIGMAMIIVQLIATMGVLVGVVYSTWSASHEHKWAHEARISAQTMALETYKAMLLLEKNTNSIKDALVKVTREAAYAEGLKDGGENS